MTVNIQKLSEVLNERGWYALSIRVHLPLNRAKKFQGEWTDELIKDYLELHCGIDEAKYLLDRVLESNHIVEKIGDCHI